MKQFILFIAITFLLVASAFALQTIPLLSATTSATVSNTFIVDQGRVVTVMLTGTVGSGETADIQISNDDGSTWISDSTQLTDTELVRVVVGPGLFRVNKGATAAAAGVTVSR